MSPENRLVTMEECDSVTRPAGAPPRRRVTFAYDYRHRRVAKEVREWSAGDGAFSRLVKSRRYAYDRWNMIAELDTTDSPSTSLQQARVVSTYVWGPDLAGQQGSVFAPESLTSAGGVGGLLAVNHQGTTYYPCMDANGNIMGLVDATTGTLTARYDYDPFGARITDTGPTGSNGERIELCPFGFSTKYSDSETGLVYYGYRYLRVDDGRWLNRDPIEEQGGVNLYGMVGNDAVNRWDMLGNAPGPSGPRWYTKGFAADAYGVVPWYLTAGWTSPWFVGGAVGASIELVYNCRDGTAAAFATALIGVGVGTPGVSVSTGKGVNIIYNLATASAYAGGFVSITASATAGALGGYGTGFTTPAGASNLATTGSFGGETYGFGGGWAAGTPGAGVLLSYQYFWDLGPIPFSAATRAKVRRCVSGTPTSTGKADVPEAELRQMARQDGDTVKAALKAKLKANVPIGTSTTNANRAIDQAQWQQ